MRGDGVRCDVVAEALPRIVDGTRRADRPLARHVECCLTCQVELARYRRMLRLLHQLREQRPPLPPGALHSIVTGIEARAGQQVVRSALGSTGRPAVRALGTGMAAVATLAALGAVAAVAVGARGRRPAEASPAGPGRGGAARMGVGAAGAARIGALLTWPDGPSGYGPPAKATAAALGVAEGQ